VVGIRVFLGTGTTTLLALLLGWGLCLVAGWRRLEGLETRVETWKRLVSALEAYHQE